MPVTDREKTGWHTVDFLILSGLILTILATVLTNSEESRWVGHAVAGTFSLILVITVMATGGMLTGALEAGKCSGFSPPQKGKHMVQYFCYRDLSFWPGYHGISW